MFEPRKKMDPYYAGLENKGKLLTTPNQKEKLVAMNWADPFRPDDTVPEHVKKATIDCINSTGAHYTFPSGDVELRKEIVKRVKKVNGLDVDVDNIIISGGSDIAFLFSVRPFITPGEGNEVMIPTPSYSNNFVTAPLCGGKTVTVPTFPEDNYALRIEEFEKRVTPNTKVVLFTNPNNPTSTVYTRENLEQLSEFIIKHDLICIVDQCFEDVVFDGHEMTCIATLPGMAERTIIISSLSKGMGLCGYRVGYIVASKEIMEVLNSVAVVFLGAPNSAAQAGIIAGLQDTAFMEEYRQEYMIRAKAIMEILDEIPHITYSKPESSFFFWLDISYYGTDTEVVTYLAEHASVLLSDGKMFGDTNHVRLIYASLRDREECLAAVRRVRDALLSHPANQ